ncbi:MAG: pseudouridine synthase [Polyangiaceae bacterium]
MAQERLQKILARGGFSSRRAAEAIITSGRVRVNGKVVTELGAKADPRSDKVELDGKRVVAEEAVYVIVHKPRGVVATLSDPEGRPTVKEMLSGFGVRLFPVGRLDFATSGALLATNDGAFSEGLLHPKRAVPKTYVVKVAGVMEKEHLDVWRNGVTLDDGPTLPAEATFLRHEGDKTWFTLTIKEGRNQQIRRMGEATGFTVMRLSRTSFAGISTDGMKPGAARLLTREELLDLKKAFGVPRKLPSVEGVARAAAAFITKRRPARLRVDDHGHAKPGFRGEPRTPREGHTTGDEPTRFRAAGPSEERRDRRPRPQGEGFQGKPRAPRSRDEGQERRPRPQGEGFQGKPRAPRSRDEGQERRPRPQGEGFQGKPRAPRSRDEGQERRPRPQGEGFQGKPRAPRSRDEGQERRPRPQGEGFQGKPRAPRSRDEGTSPGRRGAPKGRSSR